MGAWTKLYKPVEEGGIGVRGLREIKRSFHMKFACRLLSDDSLWNRFFEAKYVKGDHLICSPPNAKGSRFHKNIYKMILEVFENCYT